MARIGFIGVGNMGGPMARNLLKAGHQVKAYDLSGQALSAVTAAGASGARSAAEAASEVDAVVTMFDRAKRQLTLSIKSREIREEKEAVAQFGSSDSGASLGDILGAAISRARQQAEQRQQKPEEDEPEGEAIEKDEPEKDEPKKDAAAGDA